MKRLLAAALLAWSAPCAFAAGERRGSTPAPRRAPSPVPLSPQTLSLGSPVAPSASAVPAAPPTMVTAAPGISARAAAHDSMQTHRPTEIRDTVVPLRSDYYKRERAALASSAALSPAERPRAIEQLRGELKGLSAQLKEAEAAASLSAHPAAGDYRGGSEEASARAFERASGLRAQMGQVRAAQRVLYHGLKSEADALERDRRAALAVAASMGAARHDYKGGAAEAAARELERAGALQSRLNGLRREMGLIERDNPAFAGLRAPIVWLKNLLGISPLTAQEQAITDRIAALQHQRAQAAISASIASDPRVGREFRGGSEEARGRALERMAAIDAEIARNRAALDALR